MTRLKKVTRRGLFVLSLLLLSGALFLTQATAQGTGSSEQEGKDLFSGAQRFENGGPPCMACHSAGDLGNLGGGDLGPDLTPAYDKFGEEGLASILNTLSFPTMQPLFVDRPLTSAEQTDLLAYFQQASVEKRSGNATLALFLWGLGGAIVLLIIAGLVWMRHLNGVREPMVARSKRTS